MAKHIRRIPKQSRAKRVTPRGQSVRKTDITGQYNLLRDTLIQTGLEERVARESMEALRRIHNEYWSATTEFGHLLHQCRRKNCRQSDSRLGNARALNARLDCVITEFDSLSDETLNAVDYLTSNPEEVADAGVKIEWAMKGLNESLFRTMVVPAALKSVQNLFDEYTSGYPYGFLSLVAKHASQMNEDMAGRFGDELYEKLVASATESFRKTLREEYEKDRQQPNYIEFLRLGHMTSPDMAWIDETGQMLVEIAKGGGRNIYFPFIEKVIFEEPETLPEVSKDPSGWPNLVGVFREDEIEQAAVFAKRSGRHSSVLGELVSNGLARDQAIDCVYLLSETKDAESGRLNKYVRSRHFGPAIVEASRLAPSLWSSPTDLATLLSGKEPIKKIRAYSQFLLQPGKRYALLAYSREKPKAKLRPFLAQLEHSEDTEIWEAVVLHDTIDEALLYLREENESIDPYELLRNRPSFSLLATNGVLSRLEKPEFVQRACDFLDQVYVPRVRECLARHTHLIKTVLDDVEGSGGKKTDAFLRRQDEFIQDPYRSIVGHYTEPIVPDSSEALIAQRIVFIGDCLRPDDLQSIADILGVAYVHVPRGWSLDSLRKMITGGDCVAYHVKQAGHSHSGHVKWMTESEGGIWVELYATNKDRICDRLAERLAS